MRQRPSKLRRPGLLAAAFAVVMVAAACAFALPARAVADEASVVAYSLDRETGVKTEYTSIDDAVAAGCSEAHPTIVMTRDWEIASRILIPGDTRIAIDMHGYSIKAAEGSTERYVLIEVGKNTEVTLGSSVTKELTYMGFDPATCKTVDVTTTTGGLVTECAPSSYNAAYLAAILAHEGTVINLEGITVAGNYGPEVGGVYLDKRATLNMRKGASIEHNIGSGVRASGEGGIINMDNASISYNNAPQGGGIMAHEDSATVTMSNGAKIAYNQASAGGGIYFRYSKFAVTSPDGTGVISNNSATKSDRSATKDSQSGGGIHADQREFGENRGLIEGITISDNYSAYDGGGLELDQESTVVRNCTITGNWCKFEGGGAYVCNDKNTFENCTITGNACSVDSGGNYEGGGVFVWHSYDVELKGMCVIKGNTRGKDSGNADDVFLRENGGATVKAYITGNLAKGSSVGVRTGVTGDRRIAKNFKHETNDCLFYDMSGYYVSYGSDEGGDAWQRNTPIKFAVSIDGKAYGRYRDGTTAAVAAPATKDGKVFWRWDTQGTTGLYPVGDYITEKGALSNALAFTMPQNDVNLVPLYTDKVTAVRFQVEAPEAGRPLATAGKLWRSDGGASAESAPCSVYWYEVDEHGNVSDTAAAGLAKANTAYKAYLAAPEAGELGFFYGDEVSAAVSLVSASGDLVKELGPDAIKTYLTLSNDLAAHVDDAYTTGDGAGDVETGTVKVQMKNQGLLGGGASAAAAMALDADAEGQADVIDTVEVSYSYSDVSDAVTIAAPAREGFNFCNWEVAGDAVVSDEDTVTIPVEDLLNIESLTAIYTPVVTKVEVEMDEPAPAAGEKLATSVGKLVLTGSDGSKLDLVEAIGEGPAAVTWSPEPEDGLAGYSTAYTALVELADADGLEGVEKVVAGNAEVSVTCAGGAVEAEAAGFTVVDGELCLAVSFPATRDAKVICVSAPADVELTFEQAKACAELGTWPLQKSVDLEVESGVAAEGDVAWEAVEGFDADATAAQQITVKGAVTHVAYDGDLDTDGLDTSVTVTVKVAAPTSGDSGKKDDAEKKDDTEKKDDAGATDDAAKTETKTASKKGTPATGDVTFTGAAGLLAAAAVCLAAARVSRRNN